LNGFFDFGRVTKKIDLGTTHLSSNYYKADAEKFHNSAGAGLRVVMNQNFVIALDYGRALDKQDGKSGMYIGLNYIF
jgi:hemolysin activation/secretion protein